MGDSHIHITGRGVAVFLGVMCLIGAFSGSVGLGGGIGLFLLGGLLILLGVR